jgi:hypothetical protein
LGHGSVGSPSIQEDGVASQPPHGRTLKFETCNNAGLATYLHTEFVNLFTGSTARSAIANIPMMIR